MTFRINFIPFGSSTPARTWSGYATREEARRALADADLCIPVHWDHEIVQDPPSAFDLFQRATVELARGDPAGRDRRPRPGQAHRPERGACVAVSRALWNGAQGEWFPLRTKLT